MTSNTARPDLKAASPATSLAEWRLHRFDDMLAQEASDRTTLLERAPRPLPDDLVAAAHRARVARTLQEIDAARVRIRRGTFGTCVECGEPIPIERLESRPWVTRCVPCSRQPLRA